MRHISTAVACGFMDFRYAQDDWRKNRPHLTEWYESFAQRPSMMRTRPGETPQRSPK
jgi:glutathione S-transferase